MINRKLRTHTVNPRSDLFTASSLVAEDLRDRHCLGFDHVWTSYNVLVITHNFIPSMVAITAQTLLRYHTRSTSTYRYARLFVNQYLFISAVHRRGVVSETTRAFRVTIVISQGHHYECLPTHENPGTGTSFGDTGMLHTRDARQVLQYGTRAGPPSVVVKFQAKR